LINDARILLVTRDSSLAESIRRVSDEVGQLTVRVMSSLDQAYAYDEWEGVALVLIHRDARCTTAETGRFLRMMAAARRPAATIVVMEKENADEAAELLRLGAADILNPPFDMGVLSYLIDTLTLRSRRLRVTTPVDVHVEASSRGGDDPILDQARKIAPLDATVLIQGAPGTGKSRLTRTIHDLSPRRHGPLVTVRCELLAPDGLGDELFGPGIDRDVYPERFGRATEARGGTIVFDDVDTLTHASQVALVRWIEDPARRLMAPTHAPRLIATSRTSLADAVSDGRFRSDLFFRLNVIGFQLAPVSERGEELPALAKAVLHELAGPSVSLSAEAIQAIQAHEWPGNLREIREVFEMALAHCRGPILGRDLLPTLVRNPTSRHLIVAAMRDESTRASDATLAQTKSEAEFARITQALEKHGQNRLRTAHELGISRMTLYKKLYKYGIIDPPGSDGVASTKSGRLANRTGQSLEQGRGSRVS
jgi:DNA-binding NtrC family response regulator